MLFFFEFFAAADQVSLLAAIEAEETVQIPGGNQANGKNRKEGDPGGKESAGTVDDHDHDKVDQDQNIKQLLPFPFYDIEDADAETDHNH